MIISQLHIEQLYKSSHAHHRTKLVINLSFVIMYGNKKLTICKCPNKSYTAMICALKWWY